MGLLEVGDRRQAGMSWLARGNFFLSFASARGIQFLAPVLAANLLAVSDYGTVEWAHATASLLVTLLSLGTAGVVPFALLGAERRGSLPAILLHQTVLSVAIAFLAIGIASLSGFGSRWTLALLFTGLLALQSTWTYVLRSRGHDSTSLFLEASPMSLVAVLALLAWHFDVSNSLPLITIGLAIGLVLLFAPSVRVWVRSFDEAIAGYRETLRLGIPMMAGGLLSMLATTSGRIGIGLLGDAELTGIYATIARISALPIVAHQLAVTSKFRGLFSESPERLQRLLIQVSTFVLVAVVLLHAVVWLDARLMGPAFDAAAAKNSMALVLLPAQTVLWSGVALNDLVASRHHVLGAVVPWSATGLLSFFAMAIFVLPSMGVTVDMFAVWHTAAMAVLFAAQSISMAVKSVRFTKYWGATWGCFLIALCVGYLVHMR